MKEEWRNMIYGGEVYASHLISSMIRVRKSSGMYLSVACNAKKGQITTANTMRFTVQVNKVRRHIWAAKAYAETFNESVGSFVINKKDEEWRLISCLPESTALFYISSEKRVKKVLLSYNGVVLSERICTPEYPKKGTSPCFVATIHFKKYRKSINKLHRDYFNVMANIKGKPLQYKGVTYPMYTITEDGKLYNNRQELTPYIIINSRMHEQRRVCFNITLNGKTLQISYTNILAENYGVATGPFIINFPHERWAEIDGSDNYCVSTFGRVKKNIWCSGVLVYNRLSYSFFVRQTLTVSIAFGGKHRNLALTYIMWRAFKGEIPTNRWVTQDSSTQKAVPHIDTLILVKKDNNVGIAVVLEDLYGNHQVSAQNQSELARYLGCSPGQVRTAVEKGYTINKIFKVKTLT